MGCKGAVYHWRTRQEVPGQWGRKRTQVVSFRSENGTEARPAWGWGHGKARWRKGCWNGPLRSKRGGSGPGRRNSPCKGPVVGRSRVRSSPPSLGCRGCEEGGDTDEEGAWPAQPRRGLYHVEHVATASSCLFFQRGTESLADEKGAHCLPPLSGLSWTLLWRKAGVWLGKEKGFLTGPMSGGLQTQS